MVRFRRHHYRFHSLDITHGRCLYNRHTTDNVTYDIHE